MRDHFFFGSFLLFFLVYTTVRYTNKVLYAATLSSNSVIQDHLVGYWKIRNNLSGYIYEGSILKINTDGTFNFSNKVYDSDSDQHKGSFQYVRRHKSDYIYKVDMNIVGQQYFYKIRYNDTHFLMTEFAHSEKEALSLKDFIFLVDRVSELDV